MLWLALHLPRLSLEALAATLPADAAGVPLALLAQHRITAVDAAAAACGVRPGLKRATALALAPALRLGQADPARDAQALQAVLHTALGFTPMACLDAPHATVLLEVQPCLRLFGGAARLRARLHDALAPLGHQLQWAAAPTAAGAALLARWGGASHGDLACGAHATELPALQALLDEAPVWLLGPGREHWEALQGMGLQRISQLRALPRSALARRFGPALLDEIDRARGERADPREPAMLPEVFDARLELHARADSAEQLLHGAAVLLARLVAWARARHARIAAFALHMAHERHRRRADAGDAGAAGELPARTTLRVELAEPAADAAHLHALLKERLARLVLPAPTLDLRLHCRDWVRAPAPNGELFPTAGSAHEGLARLLERLRARLGDDGVQALQPVADHRPEHASRTVPLAALRGAARGLAPGWAARPAPLPLHRPAWLLPEPLPLPSGARGQGPLWEGRPLQLLAGPERIEAGWWDDGGGAAAGADARAGGPTGSRAVARTDIGAATSGLAARDYFIARAADGALVWIYRARLPLRPDAADGLRAADGAGWFLQGRFG